MSFPTHHIFLDDRITIFGGVVYENINQLWIFKCFLLNVTNYAFDKIRFKILLYIIIGLV